MRQILVLVLLTTLIQGLLGQCYSSCYQCSAYCIDCCISCPPSILELTTDNKCQSIPNQTVLSVVDGTWPTLVAPYLEHITDHTLNNYTSASAAGLSSTTGIQLTNTNFIAFRLTSIGAHFQITARASVQLSVQAGCIDSMVTLFWSNSPSSPTSYSIGSNLSLTSPSGVLSKNFPHNVGTDQFKWSFGGDVLLQCTYVTLRDVSFVIELCSTNCLTCIAFSTCTSCGLDLSGQQMYLDVVSLFCTATCSQNFYSDGISVFECNRCDIACLHCFGFTNSSCISCNNANGYVFALNSPTTCSLGCPPGQFVNYTPPFTCQDCDSGCKTCENDKFTCTSCGNDTNGKPLYLTLTNTCSQVCLLSYYVNGSTFLCDKCHVSCYRCFGFTNLTCQQCNNDGGYVLVLGTTTQCSYGCPLGQFANLTLPQTCQLCDTTCRSCQNTSIYCTSCGTDLSGKQFYLLLPNHTCTDYCLHSYYTDTLYVFACDLCHEACIKCTGVNDSAACTVCNNDQGYYFSYTSTTNCVLGCNSTEFLTGSPLTCTPCDPNCLTCKTTNVYCTSCDNTSFIAPNQTCVNICPDNYFANQTSRLCQSCHPACTVCTGSLISECSACGNITFSPTFIIYYLVVGTTLCSQNCPSGQFIDINIPNLCQQCAPECITCSGTNTSCTGDTCASGLFFYNSSCLSACPSGTTADSNNVCYVCEYFLFGGECIQQCPSGYTGIIASISTCEPCSEPTCSAENTKSFTVSSKVTDQNALEHQVTLSEGLSSNTTESKLKQGLKVVITTGQRRLLLSTTTLTVQGLTISTNSMYIYILTNYLPVSLTSSSVSVSFKAGALVTASGVSYNQLTSSVSLSSSTSFIKSYYQIFGNEAYQQAEGIVFILLSFLLLITALFFLRDFKFEHECLSLIQMIQIVGLSKLRELPFEFDFYNVLLGYTHFDLRFIPNKFADIFANSNYSEATIDSAAFSLGSQNFILNFGSIFYLYLPLQLALLIFFLIYRNNELNRSFLKNIQEYLVNLWSTIIIYGCLLCLLSVQDNEITSANMHYSITILICFVIVSAFGLYLGLIVKNHLHAELYKLHNVVRIIGLLMLAYGQNAALLVFNFTELFFIVVDFSLYKHHKINPILHFIEKGLFLIVIDSSLIEVNFKVLLAICGICFGIMTLFRCYYLTRIMIDKCKDEDREEDRQKIEANASMDLSVSDKVQYDKEHLEIKSASNSLSQKGKTENKLGSHQTLMEPSSVVFQENPHNQAKVQGSLNELRPPMKDPSMDNRSDISDQIRLTMKRKRTRLEPVIVRQEKKGIQSEADQVDIIKVDNFSERDKSEGSERVSEKSSEPEQQVWK